MSTRPTGVGIVVAVFSALTFATAGPFGKALLETGWTPAAVVLVRVAGAALLLLPWAVRALEGRWRLLARSWRAVLGYGLAAVAVPQIAFFYAVQYLSVGVALLLEYLALVLVVVWQCVVARRWPRSTTVVGIVLAVTGLVLVLDVFGGVRISGIGVVWGLVAACGLASYFLMSGHAAERPLPPLVLADGGLVIGAVAFAVLGVSGALPMSFGTGEVLLAGRWWPWWTAAVELAVIAAAAAYVTGIVAARVLGAKLASFVGLSEVMFAVLLAWMLLGELPRPVQLLGGLFILAGVAVVRLERAEAFPAASSAFEPGLALEGPTIGNDPVVPHDGVELGAHDVLMAQDESGVIGTVEQHGPV